MSEELPILVTPTPTPKTDAESRAIGRQIATARTRRGLTQAALAQQIGVSESTVQRWEGGALPPYRRLLRLAQLLVVPLEELIEVRLGMTEQIAALRDEIAEIKTMLERLL
jgi:transcriptional regulator with XRE-family HTH domain